MNNYQLIKFKDKDFELDVNVSSEEKTVWLTKEEIAHFYERSRSAISKHIKQIYDEHVQEKASTCAKNAQVQLEGNRKVKRTIEYYNLEMILAIGQRIKSQRGLLLNQFLNNYISSIQKDNDDIIIYNNGNVNLSVNVSPKEETVWLNVNQIAELFETTTNNIYIHIKNIFNEGELSDSVVKESSSTDSVSKNSLPTAAESSIVHPTSKESLPVHKDYLYTAADGKQYITTFYNLDVILSVGYRVKSKRAVEFRRWVNTVLKQYLLKGYVIDSNRVTISKDNFIKLETDVQNIKEEIRDIKEKVFIEPVKERLFYDGEYFDAHEFINKLIQTAKEEIIVIDPYIDIDGLSLLKNTSKDIRRIVCASNKAKIYEKDVEAFTKQYGEITIIKNNLFHDRFMIIDGKECYSLGASFNYMGKRVFAVIKIEDEHLIKALINKTDA